MRQRIKPAPVGGEQSRHREVVHDAGKAGRIIERALGVGQCVVGRKQFDAKQSLSRFGTPPMRLGISAPGERDRDALGRRQRAFAKQRGAARGAPGGGGGQAQAFGLESHQGSVLAVQKPAQAHFLSIFGANIGLPAVQRRA